MNDVVTVLIISIPLVPFLIIYIVGAALSVTRWRRYPTPSRLAFIAFVMFSARSFLGLARNWLLHRRDALAEDKETFIFYLGIMGSIETLVAIVAWILLLIAFYSRFDMSERHVASGEEFSEISRREG